ncbi:MAG: RodZ domain-containing protein [Pseudomonadota bacterium]
MTGTTDLHNDIPPSSPAGQGPGRLVRQAREKNKLSIEDLAAQIKLSRFTLDAIERDDFAQLNEPVYVRGYYRKLAKVLPVAEAELLAAYERVAGHRAPPHPSKLILAGGAELGSGRRISPKLAVAVVLIGLVVGGLAFWGKNRNLEQVVTAPAPVTESVTPAAQVQEPVASPSSLVPQPELIAPEPASEPVEAAPAAAAPAGAPAAAPAAETSLSGPLLIQFDGTSWAEVKDAAGRVLVSGLIEAGSKQQLDGKPPFVVFLGNAPAVRIEFNGKPVDVAQFRRADNTARLVLP